MPGNLAPVHNMGDSSDKALVVEAENAKIPEHCTQSPQELRDSLEQREDKDQREDQSNEDRNHKDKQENHNDQREIDDQGNGNKDQRNMEQDQREDQSNHVKYQGKVDNGHVNMDNVQTDDTKRDQTDDLSNHLNLDHHVTEELNLYNEQIQSNVEADLQDDSTHQNGVVGHGLSSQEEESLLGRGSNAAPEKAYEDDIPTPPDGGWGWIVCFAAFLCMVILDGMMFSFGVFFLDLLDYYGQSKGKTAMVGSMLMGMHLFLGPVTSALVNLWGIRPVTMAGGVVAGAAFTISVFAPNIEFLFFSYGMLGGFGVSMIYIPSILAVGFYFEKRRALANGITMAGSGMGTFIYAPLSNYLQDEYSWKGALLILAGLVLHCIVFGALYRPLKVQHKVKVKVPPSHTLDDIKLVEQCGNNITDLRSFSHGNIPKIVTSNPSVDRLKANPIPKGSSLHEIHQETDSTCTFKSAILLHHSSRLHELKPQLVYSQPTLAKQEKHHSHTSLKPLERKDIFYSGSLLRIPQYTESGASSLIQTDSAPFEEPSKMSKFAELKKTFIQIAGLKLLKNPVFILIMMSSVLWTTHSTVLTILPDYSVEQGISTNKAAIILSMIGVTNVVGRIGSGWISDQPEIDVLVVNMVALYIGGAMCLIVPFSTNYSLLLTEAGVFGLCMATWTSLRPIVLVELLGIDSLTNAFGLLAMFQGVAFVVGPPLAGLLYDITGSYTCPFLIAGIAFIFSGLLIVPLRKLKTVINRNTMVVTVP